MLHCSQYMLNSTCLFFFNCLFFHLMHFQASVPRRYKERGKSAGQPMRSHTLTSRSLPLIYINTSVIRIFCPGMKDKHVASGLRTMFCCGKKKKKKTVTGQSGALILFIFFILFFFSPRFVLFFSILWCLQEKVPVTTNQT